MIFQTDGNPRSGVARRAASAGRALLLTAGAAALALSTSLALGAETAADYPSKVIKIVSPFSAGGTNDFLTRSIARSMEAAFKKGVIVENRTGANGMIGADYVAKNAGDPHILLMGNGATHGTNSTLYPKIAYDAVKDFTPVGMVAKVPIVLIVSADLPIKSVQDLLAYAKKNPGTLSFGSSGLGGTGHMAGEKFKQVTGIDILHAPYRGDAPAVTDVLGGQIPMAFISATSVLPFVNSGKMRVLAVADDKRAPMLPNVPTLAEQGVNDGAFFTWYAIIAPANVPADIVKKLNETINNALDSQALKDSFATQGAEPVKSTPAELSAFIDGELKRSRTLIQELGIKVE